MPRPPALPVEQKVEIVLAVLAKEKTVGEAARHAQVSEQSIANWRKQFIDGGSRGLSGQAKAAQQRRPDHLADEVRKLKLALGEAYVELMAWRKVGDYRRVPSRTSR
jgi:transposase